MNLKNKILLLFILIIFSGCCALKSPVKRYDCQKQRAKEKIIVLTKKFPELLQPTDTIRLSDTLMISSVEVDTSFVFDNVNDTIIIERDKLIIEYVKRDSLVYITGECVGDTIYIEREIPIEKIVVQETPITKKIKDWTIFGFITLIVLFIINKFFRVWR